MTRQHPTIALVFQMPLDPIAGGVQRVTWQLGHYLAQKGWNVVFISLAIAGHKTPLVGRLQYPSEDVFVDRRLLRRFFEDIFCNSKPDVVINQTGLYSEPDRTLWELSKAGYFYKIITCFHNNPALFKENHRHLVRYLLRKKRWVLFFIDHSLGWKVLMGWHRMKNYRSFRLALLWCDRFILLSPTFISELRWYVHDLDESKIVIIPNGFHLPDMTGLPAKRKHFLFVGRLEQSQKNIFLLPTIWEKVQHRLPEWELHIVGDGPDRAELEAKIEKLSLKRIYVHGQMNPTEHYRVAKVFLMVSFFEGFGNTLIEAQMQGVVPVAFRSYSAIEWMLNDGVDAVLVPPFDVDRYADKLVQLAIDEVRWPFMSAAAVTNAKRFSENIVGDIWCKILSDVLNDSLISA